MAVAKARPSVVSIIVRTLISIVFLAVYFWFALPPLNLRAPAFWTFAFFGAAVIAVIFLVGNFVTGISAKRHKNGTVEIDGQALKSMFGRFPLAVKILAGAAALVIAVYLLSAFIFSPLFFASSYRDMLQTETGDFTEDISEISWTQIPVVDRDSASRLGSRKLGEIDELVSQFEVAENYTQINYQDRATRVTPLLYGDFFKWFKNQATGIPAYISVDMATQETQLKWLDQPIRYSESEYFMRNIHRYLRFAYPTKLFDDVSFEIDENGTPYWVASTYTYRFGLASGHDANGAVLVNAVTGEHQFYAVGDIPSWVDQVYDADMILTQLAYYGEYQNGFWNSVFGQTGVKYPTDGYNYLAIDDDVWLYTGMTSAGGDESNVGFVLVNLRTKETKYYAVPGAEEYSAMSSAEGQVQHLGYEATFPLLINVGDRPTYFMSLKDNAGLVKMYAFVDVEQYQIVGTGNTVELARKAYTEKLSENDVHLGTDNPDNNVSTEITGTIQEIRSAVENGNTVYYFTLVEDYTVTDPTSSVFGGYYKAEISASHLLPFWKAGDKVTFTIKGGRGELNAVTAVKSWQMAGLTGQP